MTIQQPLQFNNQRQTDIVAPVINSRELAISGPVFDFEPGWGGKLSVWIKNNLEKAVLPLFAILTLLSGIYLYLVKTENGFALFYKTSQKTSAPVTPLVASYKYPAQKGEGLTHIARKSLSAYLELNPQSEITPEHKIYIEDLLQKQKGNRLLYLGETTEFTPNEIQKAIDRSRQLKKEDLENLSKYIE